jgi:hypothetical protein
MNDVQTETRPPDIHHEADQPEAEVFNPSGPSTAAYEAPRHRAAGVGSVAVEASQSTADLGPDIDSIRQSVQTALGRHESVLPAVASSLAARLSERAAPDLPSPRTITADEVKRQEPWLGAVSSVVGFFSSGLGRRLDGYIARKGQERIDRVTEKVAASVNVISTYEAPKKQFVAEITAIRNFVANGEQDGKGPGGATPESRLAYLLDGIADTGRKWRGNATFGGMLWLEQNCPIIKSSLSVYMNPTRSMALQWYRYQAKIAAPEILAGLEQFLGQADSAPVPTNIADQTTGRFIAEKYASERLRGAPAKVVKILRHAYQLLPDNGPDFKQRVTTMASQTAIAGSPQAELLHFFDEYYRMYAKEDADDDAV